ncbi:hypothetical protein BJS_02795 [Bradyrhizobium japonicum SEMIA 5079]|nr:hypothetical protein BJS_02795 [Bradyrhizobium japonicum SEMIA 5079]
MIFLLDLGFAEFDVLARDRIVLLLDQLVGHGARILLGDVVEAGVGRGHELDLDGDRFGHVQNLRNEGNLEPAKRPALAGNLARNRLMSRFRSVFERSGHRFASRKRVKNNNLEPRTGL